MNEFSGLIEGAFRNIAVGPVFFTFLLIVFVYVMTKNFLKLKHEELNPDWMEGEKVLDQITVSFWWMRIKTILTNRRILQFRLSWFLSKRKVKSIALKDVHSVFWRRYANWFLLLLGWNFFGVVNPLAFILVLLALERKVYSVRFDTPFAQMPFARLGVITWTRKQLGEMVRFYRNSQKVWASMRLENGLPGLLPPLQVPQEEETDFAWGRPVWVYIALFMVCAVWQSVFEPKITFDDFIVAPIYLGLPVAVARRNLRDGIWVAIAAFVGVLTIKFPGANPVGLLPGGGIFSAFLQFRGPFAYIEEYIMVMITLLLMVWAAHFISSKLSLPGLAFVAVFIWLGFVALHMPVLLYDYALYSKIALAMAASILLAAVEKAIGHSYDAAF